MHTLMALQMITFERSCVQLIVQALPKLLPLATCLHTYSNFSGIYSDHTPFIVKGMYTRRGVVNVYFKFFCLILIHGNRFRMLAELPRESPLRRILKIQYRTLIYKTH